MLHTEDFNMRHYVGFSQIRSHFRITQLSLNIDQTGLAQNESCVTEKHRAYF